MPRALVLFSGGLDSTTVLKITKNRGWEIFALSFNYGQNHNYELECASRIVKDFSISCHKVISFDMRTIGGSFPTDTIEIPKNREESEMKNQIPSTYVPARNSIFLSFGIAWAETLDISDIFLGVNAVDYSGYPDCRPEYIQAFEQMANLATKNGVEGKTKLKIHTPLINLSKGDIIKLGIEEGVDFSLTNSCYDPQDNGAPCGLCDSCLPRAKGFEEAKELDPLLLKYGLT